MPRHIRVLDGAYGMVEDMLYSIGDAEDFVNREQPNFCEYVDRVAMGEMSASEAKRRINDAFANAMRQVREARELVAANGRRMGFSHLYESPHEEPIPLPMGYRVVAELPQEPA